MTCPKCSASSPESATFCWKCGKKLTVERGRKKTKSRANGTGTAYKRGNTWTACVVVGWRPSKDESHKIPQYRTKGGFSTKRDALNYCPTLKAAGKNRLARYTLNDVYLDWYAAYSPRVDESTMKCYKAAYGHFKRLKSVFIDLITATDLQKCMDDCKNGKRTHQNMKVTAGLIWAYAVDSDIVKKDVTDNLYIGRHETKQRDPLTEDEVEAIRQAIGEERYADYIYAMCYLGFRPGEFLSLRKEHYRVMDGIEVLVNGSKTEAGKDRVVVIPPQILDIVRSRLYIPGTDMIFPQYCFKKQKDVFTGFKQMKDAYLREWVFKPMMARLGIAEGKVPYSARHTYSDKLKRAEGTDKTKAGLMGHTDYAFTQSHYQSTDMDDLLTVAVSIE